MMTCLSDRLAALGIEPRHMHPGTQRLRCPECDKGPRDTALALTVHDDGAAVWLCHRCGFKGSARDHVESFTRPTQKLQAPRKAERQNKMLSPEGHALWTRSEPIRPGTVAAQYLEHRACMRPPADGDLRWMPSCWHPPSRTRHPALIGLITDTLTSKPISLHFTYLKPDGSGKADIERPKLLLAGHRKAGGCIRLWPDEAITQGLLVGEGVETVLTAARGYQPAWCLIDSGNLGTFPVLAGIEALVICVDHDPAGIKASTACAKRWTAAGREVRLFKPGAPSEDVNDWGRAA